MVSGTMFIHLFAACVLRMKTSLALWVDVRGWSWVGFTFCDIVGSCRGNRQFFLSQNYRITMHWWSCTCRYVHTHTVYIYVNMHIPLILLLWCIHVLPFHLSVPSVLLRVCSPQSLKVSCPPPFLCLSGVIARVIFIPGECCPQFNCNGCELWTVCVSGCNLEEIEIDSITLV